jgi:hypothetical protein
MAVRNFDFPGFQYRRAEDSATHEVEIGYIMDGGLVFQIKVARNIERGDDRPFRITEVNRGSDTVWSIKGSDFNGVSLLTKVGDALVIAMVGFGKSGMVEEVIPFSKFYANTQMDLLTKVKLKHGAAEFLGRECKYSSTEALYNKVLIERYQAKREAERKEAAEARDAKRIERIKVILSRGKIRVYTAEGHMRFGWPVMKDEWASLSNKAHAILVDSVGEDGSIGKAIEAFIVVKGDGKNPEKAGVASVTVKRPTNPVAAKKVAVQSVNSTIIEVDGTPYEVFLYKDMDAIRQARAAGLNSGTYVAINGKKGATIEVHAVHKDRVDTLGNFEALI